MKQFLLVFFLVCGAVSGLRAEPFPYTLRWKWLAGDPLQGVVALHDSAVFVGGADGRLLALDRQEGRRRWQRRGNGPLQRPPAVSAGVLICADAWGRLLALEQDTGALRWEAQRLGWGEAEIAVRDSLAYVAAADGWLYAFRCGDGSQAWRVRIGPRSVARPCLDGERLYVATRDGRLLGVEAGSGRHQSSVALGSRVVAGPLVAGEYLVVAGDDGYVRAFDRQRLEMRWERRLGDRVLEPLAVAEGRLIVAAENGWVYGLALEDGQVAWKRGLTSKPQGGVVNGPREELVVGAADGWLVGLAAESGAAIWEVQLLEATGVRPQAAAPWLYVSAGDGYLYAFAEPSPLRNQEGVRWEDWWEAFSLGRKTGYRHRVVQEGFFEGKAALRLAEEGVEWRSGFHRSVGEVWVDPACRPLAFAQRTVEGSQVIEVEGRWKGDSLRVEQRLAGGMVAQTAVVGRDLVLPEAVFVKLGQEGRLAAGRRDSLLVLDYVSMRPRRLRLSCAADGEGLAVRQEYADSLWAGIEIQTWVDAEGREGREEVPLLGIGQRRVDEAQARSWVAPGPFRKLWLDYPLEAPPAIEELVLGLPDGLGDPRRLFVEEERQRLVQEADGRFRLTVRRVADDGRGALQLPIREVELAPYLQSSLYIQADDERIQALARQLVGEERDAWKVAVRLRRWVYDQMIPRDTQVRFKSTLEVLEDMEGTCSEYAVLFMALCQAAGVPVRACVGFLAGESGELVLHIWTQVYVGRWVDMDPSQGEDEVSAAHLKTGQGRLTGEDLQRMNLPLQRFLVQADTLALREYRAPGKRFLAAAEALFDQARSAERTFQDERAQELYHRIALLPWNQRSGQAYISIARYHLQRQEPAAAVWAGERILRLDPQGEEGDDALFFLSRAAEGRGVQEEAIALLEQLVADFPDHDLADEALGRLGEIREKQDGCEAAVPYYERLREEYPQSGWAAVAATALARCSREGRQIRD